MFGRVHHILRGVRHHPRLTAAAVLLVLATVAAAGVHFWGRAELRAAEDAFRTEQYSLAASHIEACLRVWPRSAEAHFLAARIERFRAQYEEAAEQLRAVERLNGVSERTQTEWVLLRAQRGEIDEVAEALWYCVAHGHPETPMILETLAHTYMHLIRLTPALAALNRWVEVEPRCARAQEWRGWVRERLGDPQGARTDYEKAVELEPGRFEARLRLVALLLENERYPEVREHLKILLRSHPDRAEVLSAEARCELVDGNSEQARQLVDRTLANDPNNLAALLQRGQMALDAGNAAEAEASLRHVLKLDSVNITANYALCAALARLHRPAREVAAQKARFDRLSKDGVRLTELLRKQAQSIVRDPEVLAEMGALLIRLGQEGKGVERLHEALNLDPNCKLAHKALIEHYEATKQPEQATEHRRYLAEHNLN